MTTSHTTDSYMLLFRGPEWDVDVSPEELQERANRVMAWFDDLEKRGVLKGGRPLASSGRVVSGGRGRVVADGPFAESKEAIGGYLVLEVNDLEAATAIAKSCPTLEFGTTIEVRPVLEECPVFARARKLRLSATTA